MKADVFIFKPFLIIVWIVSSEADTGYFWHITDFHYDFTYHGAQLSCNSDQLSGDLGKFGDFWCDSPWTLVNSSVHAMAHIKPDADFVLWTGDTVLHGTDEDLNYTLNAEVLDNITDILHRTLPGVPVYASFGNHDYWPNNQFPPENNRLYNDTLDRWRDWINDPSQHDNFRKGAYYTVKTQYSLRIIALNTNLYYTSNKAVLNHTDPGGQLAWLNGTLEAAKHSNEKVLITAHIPPGVHTPNSLIWMHEIYHNPFLAILRNYADIIVGMHFGHDHADGFKVLTNTNGDHATPIFIAPSVTPWRYKIPNEIGPAHNPGIRLVKYDRTTGGQLDILQYYLDLQKANKDGVAIWNSEYNATTHYNINELSVGELKKLIDRMKNANGNEFQSFWRHFTVSPPQDLQKPCDETCHASIICGFTEFEMQAFQACKMGMISGSPYIHASFFYILAIFVILFLF